MGGGIKRAWDQFSLKKVNSQLFNIYICLIRIRDETTSKDLISIEIYLNNINLISNIKISYNYKFST